MYNKEPQVLVFTIPIFEPLPTQYYVKASLEVHGFPCLSSISVVLNGRN